jgi:hypothetical protein
MTRPRTSSLALLLSLATSAPIAGSISALGLAIARPVGMRGIDRISRRTSSSSSSSSSSSIVPTRPRTAMHDDCDYDSDDDVRDRRTSSSILVVGASGGTGYRALSGLLDAGWHPSNVRVLTRNATSDRASALLSLGFDVRYADMDIPSTLMSSSEIFRGCSGCYVHSTSGDLRELDDGEVRRAINLVRAIRASNDDENENDVDDEGEGGGEERGGSARRMTRVVYNSAAAEDGHGVRRIAQKHDVERAFRDGTVVDDGGSNDANANEGASSPSSYTFVSLRANLFMEELWKGYTRPAILRGKYPFSVDANRDVYLTSVRDMGRLAGTILGMPSDEYRNWTMEYVDCAGGNNSSVTINVAGDVLTPRMMADAFGRVRNTTCVHDRSRLFGLFARLFFRDLYEVIRFYRRSTEITDVEALRARFPGLLTTFEEFLVETRWADANREYEDLSIADTMDAPPPTPPHPATLQM